MIVAIAALGGRGHAGGGVDRRIVGHRAVNQVALLGQVQRTGALHVGVPGDVPPGLIAAHGDVHIGLLRAGVLLVAAGGPYRAHLVQVKNVRTGVGGQTVGGKSGVVLQVLIVGPVVIGAHIVDVPAAVGLLQLPAAQLGQLLGKAQAVSADAGGQIAVLRGEGVISVLCNTHCKHQRAALRDDQAAAAFSADAGGFHGCQSAAVRHAQNGAAVLIVDQNVVAICQSGRVLDQRTGSLHRVEADLEGASAGRSSAVGGEFALVILQELSARAVIERADIFHRVDPFGDFDQLPQAVLGGLLAVEQPAAGGGGGQIPLIGQEGVVALLGDAHGEDGRAGFHIGGVCVHCTGGHAQCGRAIGVAADGVVVVQVVNHHLVPVGKGFRQGSHIGGVV